MNLLPSRRFSRRAFLGMAVAAAANGAYAWGIEPKRLEITRRTLELPRLPGALDGLRIAVLSDIHYEPDWQEPLLREAIHAVNAENVDLVALPGDFVTNDPKVLQPLAPILGTLRATHGVYASMGNHDVWHSGRERLRGSLEPQGIGFLCNQSTRLQIRGQRLDVVGTGSAWGGGLDPDRAFKGTRSDTTFALVHEPDPFEELGSRSFLQVSGHTHGGQCRVPLLGCAPVKVRYGEKFIYGDFSSRDGGRLFVTRGLGTVGLRVRYACLPEVAVLTLRAAG